MPSPMDAQPTADVMENVHVGHDADQAVLRIHDGKRSISIGKERIDERRQ